MNVVSTVSARTVLHVAETSWQAAVLAAVVVLLGLLLREKLSARWRCALWLVVVARLLMPVAPESPVSLFNLFPTGLASTMVVAPPAETLPPIEAMTPVPMDVRFAADRSALSADATMDTPAAPPIEPAAESSPWWTMQNVWLALAAAWLLGTAVVLARILVLAVRLRLLLRRCAPVDDPEVRRVFEATCRELGVRRRVGLVASPAAVGPAVAGAVCPKMIVSDAILKALSPDELRLVFLHELSHVRRHDLAVQHLWMAAQSLHWFNPAVWLAARRWQADRELACDEAVLARLDRPHQAGYGRAILRVMESLASLRPVPGAVGVLTRRGVVARRITMIARYRPLARRWTFLAAGLLLLLIPLGLTNAEKTEPRPSGSGVADKAGANDRSLTVAAREDSSDADAATDLPAENGSVALADAVRELNEQAAKMPESRGQRPLTEKEVLDATARLGTDERLTEAERRSLRRIADTHRLPKGVVLRQFVRFGSSTDVEHGWWVRLVVDRESQGPMSATIRQQSLFRRPYTQKERLFLGQLNDGMPTIGRLVAYFDEDPSYGVEQAFSREAVQRLAETVKQAVANKDPQGLLKSYHWAGVDKATRAEVVAEAKRFVSLPVRSVSVRPKRFDGRLLHWQGFQLWDPNLPVLGYIVLEYTDRIGPASISLEFGDDHGTARLVNYIVTQDDRSRFVGKPMSSPIRVQGFNVRGPKGQWLEYYSQIDAPRELPALRQANFEVLRVAFSAPSMESPQSTGDTVTQTDGLRLTFGRKGSSNEDAAKLLDTITRRLAIAEIDLPSAPRVTDDGQVEVLVPAKSPDVADRIHRLLSYTGVLEFRILANESDHKELIERARKEKDDRVLDDSGEWLARWVPVARGHESEFEKDSQMDGRIARRTSTEDGREVLEVLVVNDTQGLTDRHLKLVRSENSEGRPSVVFTLTDDGGKRMFALTAANRPVPDIARGWRRKLGVLFEGRLFTAPAIVSPINKEGKITGSFTQDEVDNIVAVLGAQILRNRSATPNEGPEPRLSGGGMESNNVLEETITITGHCVNENDRPVAGAEVIVFGVGGGKPGKVAEATTDDKGEFRFGPLSAPRSGVSQLIYTVLARKPGRASAGVYVNERDLPPKPLRFKMPPAARLSGRVIDAAGKPIEGALVGAIGLVGTTEEVFAARTDSRGRFAIDDFFAWDLATSPVKVYGGGTRMTMTGSYSPDGSEDAEAEQRSKTFGLGVPQRLFVRHPFYAASQLKVEKIPSDVEVILRPPAVIEGRVIDAGTGLPVAGIVVSVRGTSKNAHQWSDSGVSDRDGYWRVGALPAGEYDVQTESRDRPNVGRTMHVLEGQTKKSPDLRLVQGGLIEGRIVDAQTGQGIGKSAAGMGLIVVERGRDGDGPPTQLAAADENGRFRLHVLPGRVHPRITDPELWKRIDGRETFEKDGVEVKEGQAVTIEFRVRPAGSGQ